MNNVRLKEVFYEARLLPAAEQETYVRDHCPDDPALAAEILSLLGDHKNAGAFLSGPLLSPDGITDAPHAGPREQPGSTIGRYKLLEIIGEGGFGSVFCAEQLEPVRRTVALKVIKLGMDTRQVIARFEHERQALALMDHPNIARVLDAGATQAGRPYFVMELVRGDPITTYCDTNKLGMKERLEVFVQVCHAVQHAHQKGIIHRDLKPSNILVTVADDKPVPKVIDFGIAKETGPRLTDSTLFTEHRALIGTPEYMSPEQAEMGAVDIDTRTDIYSLGVLLYELLTGATPFDPKRLRSASCDEMQRIIREDEPPRPSARLSAMKQTLADVAAKRDAEPARLGGQIRGDLDWIVMKCLEKDRSRRYESASALTSDIARHLAGEPVAAAPPSRVYRMGKFLRRRRVPVIAGSMVALSLLAAAAGTTTFALREARRARETERVAEFQAKMLSEMEVPLLGDRLRQDIMTEAEEGWKRQRFDQDEIAARRQQLTRLLADSNFTNTAIKGVDWNIFDRGIRAIDRDFADQPLVKASLLHHIAATCRQLSLLDRAAQTQDEALRIRSGVLGREHPDTLECVDGMACVLVDQGNWNDALPYARESWEVSRRVLGEHHARTVEATYLLASILRRGTGEGEVEAERLLHQLAHAQRRSVRSAIQCCTATQRRGLSFSSSTPHRCLFHSSETHEAQSSSRCAIFVYIHHHTITVRRLPPHRVSMLVSNTSWQILLTHNLVPHVCS